LLAEQITTALDVSEPSSTPRRWLATPCGLIQRLAMTSLGLSPDIWRSRSSRRVASTDRGEFDRRMLALRCQHPY